MKENIYLFKSKVDSIKIRNMTEGEVYLDRYGKVWTLKILGCYWCVWNDEFGFGLWDSGKGLFLLR